MKKLLALFMALCLCAVTQLAAFAAGSNTTQLVDTQVPEIISVNSEEGTASTREMTYNQAWIDAGKYVSGSFAVKNPHTFLGTKTNGTLKIESNNPNARVNVVVHDGINTIYNNTIGPGNGEVYFSSQSNSSEYVVTYFVYNTNKTDGIRVNCWLY